MTSAVGTTGHRRGGDATAGTPGHPLGGGIALVVAGMVTVQVGAALATGLFEQAGVVGAVGLRLGFAALGLLALCRPRVRRLARADWRLVVAYGVALALMNLCLYEAIARIPLGVAVTLELLGPLVLSVVAARRWLAVVWAALALAGAALLGVTGVGGGRLDPVGVLAALAAAVMWATYIVLAQRSAARLPRLDGLALAMTLGALLVAPFAVAEAGTALLRPHVLLVGAAIAVLSSLLPYSLDALALRRLPSSLFAVLMSLAPVVAALSGAVLLRQPLTVTDLVAVVCVTGASAGAVLTARRGRRGGPG